MTTHLKNILFLSVSKDLVVGTIYLQHPRPDEKGVVCMFAIHPDFRGKYQIGSQLMQQIEIEAGKQRLKILTLNVVDAWGEHNQQHLINYYVKYGYALTGEKVTLMYHTFKQEITLLKMDKHL